MSRRMTEQECQQFLAQPHIGVLSVASDADRPPLTVPLWYGYQPGSNITFFTGTQGRKARKTNLIRKAGVLSLLVQREGYPYGYVTVEGPPSGRSGRRRPSGFSQSPAGTSPRKPPGGSSKRSSRIPRVSWSCSRCGRTAA